MAPGTYAEHPLLIQPNGPAITVESSGGPSVTTITGSGSGPVVTLGPNVILSVFTITGGVNNSPGGYGGGGVLFYGGTLIGNVITGNRAAYGGAGIEITDAGGTIESNTITNNTGPSGGYESGIGGGGIFITGDLTTTTITGKTIANNSWLTGDGGGISMNIGGHPTIINNIISGNLATGSFCPGLGPCAGGGAIAMEGSDPLTEQNLIVKTQADLGAGLYFGVPSGASGPTLINNTFYGNTSTQGLGSAVYASGFDGPVGIFNNLIVAATGQNALDCDYTFNPIPPVIEYNDLYSSGGNAQNCGLAANQCGNFRRTRSLSIPAIWIFILALDRPPSMRA